MRRIIPLSAIGVVICCAPTILGVTAIIIAHVFRPGRAMPLETLADRLFVNLFVYGVPVALLGLPFVCLALVGAVLIIRHEGPSSSVGRTVLITMFAAIIAAGYLVGEMRTALNEVGRRSVVSGRAPVQP